MGITEQSHRRNYLETLLPDHLFAGNHHVRSDTPGAVAQSVLKSYLKVEHQSRAQNYVNPDVLPVLPKTPVVWQHKFKQIAKKSFTHSLTQYFKKSCSPPEVPVWLVM